MHIDIYRVEWTFPAEGSTFSGISELELNVAPTESEIRLNAHELTFGRVELDGSEAILSDHPASEEIAIGPASPGAHRLRIEFQGTVRDRGLVGLYRSPSGSEQIVTSMMYPTGCRRVMPCLDHPASKSVFEATIVAPKDQQVIFNTPALHVESNGATTRWTFAPTPRMSTYLLYVGVGKFGEIQGTADGISIHVAMPPGRERTGQFSLDHACRVLPAFNAYYGIPYGLPKLHLVAVTDFWAGAMENWGAIAFREVGLLVDANTSARSRRYIRTTVTHEIAHQWFGNLVTMQWWNDFWLNESFASFMEAKLDASLYPELDVWTDFLMTFTRWGFSGDALLATHPIRVDVREPSELGQIADEITYGKGATILRMLDAYLGPERFRDGVNRYLRRHAYGNAEAKDLWAALEESGGRPVSAIMEAWMDRPGFPIVEAGLNGTRLSLRQRRFTNLPSPSVPPWPIPFTIQIGDETRSILMDRESLELEVPSGARVLLNPGRTGFYRAAYDPELLRRIRAAYATLAEPDRWGLLGDAGARLFAGEISLEEFVTELDLARTRPGFLLAAETYPLATELGPLLEFHPRLLDGFRKMFRAHVDHVGLDPGPQDTELTGRLRGRAVLGLVRTDLGFAREFAESRFGQFDRQGADLRLPLAIAQGRTTDLAGAGELEARMRGAPSEDAAAQMAVGLAAVPDPSAVLHTLGLILASDIPANRATTIVAELAWNPQAKAELWRWLEGNLPALNQLLTGTPLLGMMIEDVIPAVGVGRRGEVDAYFDRVPFPEADRGIRKGREMLAVLDRIQKLWSSAAR